MLETLIKGAGHECIFLLKFHCELNPIEMVSNHILKLSSTNSAQADNFIQYWEWCKYRYCTIQINSAGGVTCDRPAEILVSATSQTCHDMSKFSENFQQFRAAGDEKFLYLAHDHSMNSAPYKNCHDHHDISAFWRAL